jgi:hypothetical protein
MIDAGKFNQESKKSSEAFGINLKVVIGKKSKERGFRNKY